MSNSELTKNTSTSLLNKGIDVMKDPNAKIGAKDGAVAIVAIGAIAFVGSLAIKAIGQDK